MKVTSTSEIGAAISEMVDELKQKKTAAEEYLDDFKETKPEDVTLDEGYEGEEAPTPEEEGEEAGEHKKHPIEIKTTEHAKKVLDEAKEDLQAVIDNLEGVMGQSEEEGEKVAFKRVSEKYASTLHSLRTSAIKAIEDADNSLKHWAFLKKRINKKGVKVTSSDITHPDLKQVASTLEQMSMFDKLLDKLGYEKKSKVVQATAVPPTGAEFTGDKWPDKKNPAEVELRHWHAGQSEFDKDKRKEDSMPNSSDEPRLKDEGNPHDEKPYVNASYNELTRSIDVFDAKTGKAINFSLAGAPEDAGPKTAAGLKAFASTKFRTDVVDTVLQTGIESVRKQMNGTYVNAKLVKEAAKSDKSSVRKYYTEAYGDAGYSKELTSGKDNQDMNVEYKPEKDEVKNDEKNPEFGKAKDGTGKISAQDKEVIQVKANKAVELARKAAAAGIIDFNQEQIRAYAKDLMSKSDEIVAFAEKMLDNAPLVNEAALKEATIPDADSGVVGNRLEGVRNPKAQAETEGEINNNVASDAKIAKKATFVPQVNSSTPTGLQISSAFTTTEKKLREKNIDLSQTKIRLPKYKEH